MDYCAITNYLTFNIGQLIIRISQLFVAAAMLVLMIKWDVLWNVLVYSITSMVKIQH